MEEILKEIKKIDDPYLKILRFMGILTKEAKKINTNIIPVVVGGSAVFIYTFGGHITYDIDLVSSDRQAVKDVLGKLDFIQGKGLRHWYNDELNIAIEIPDDILAGEIDRVTCIQMEDIGSQVYVIGNL